MQFAAQGPSESDMNDAKSFFFFLHFGLFSSYFEKKYIYIGKSIAILQTLTFCLFVIVKYSSCKVLL